MVDVSVLYDIGLGKSEIKVYLALLELGTSTTGPIMDKAKVSSSKIYGVLSRLIEKGLVSFIIKGKTKFYHASSPNNLLEYLEEKKSSLELQKKKVMSLIPELSMKRVEEGEEAQVYLGWKGIVSAFNFLVESMKSGEDYTGFAQTAPEEASKEVKIFFSQFQRKREEKKLKVRLIAEKSQKSVFKAAPYTKFRNFSVRYLDVCPPGIVMSKSSILISTFKPSPIAVVILSKSIAESYREYFEAMWKIACL